MLPLYVLTRPLLGPFLGRVLPIFTDLFRTFLGDFNPQKLPSRRLQTLWEWKNRVLLEEYYGSFNDFRLRILLFHSTSVIFNWKRAPNEFRTCIDECPGRFERGSHRAPTLFNLCSTYVPLCSVKFRCVPLCLAVFRYVPLSIADRDTLNI